METTEWQREQWASTLEGNTEHDDEYVRHAIPRQKMAPPGRAYVVPECTETDRRTSRTGHDRTEATLGFEPAFARGARSSFLDPTHGPAAASVSRAELLRSLIAPLGARPRVNGQMRPRRPPQQPQGKAGAPRCTVPPSMLRLPAQWAHAPDVRADRDAALGARPVDDVRYGARSYSAALHR